MNHDEIQKIVMRQKLYFEGGKTRGIAFRIEKLKTLRDTIISKENQLIEALQLDLGKPAFESYTSEIMMVISEINFMIKNLKGFMKPKRVPTPLMYFGGKSFIIPEPLGVVLVIGPWNYPFQLVISPLIGAIAAGNCAVLKPSELAPHVSSFLKNMIREIYEETYITVVEGGIEEAGYLLNESFDHIFFTGGIAVGKIVMEAASKNLIPVTLELGGKSPCIVDKEINLEIAARRIAWGKFTNAGQTCVAPDYILVHEDIKGALIKKIKEQINGFYGENIMDNPDYGRIISDKHFDRLIQILKDQEVVIGGNHDRNKRFIEPTVIDNPKEGSLVMQDEIFGPILPVLTYKNVDEAIQYVNKNPKPLALYIFSNNRGIQKKIIADTSSGGVCINDTIIHISTSHLPFGGVGQSGFGNYHGKASFDTFTHYKSILKNITLYDFRFKYPPYTRSLNTLKKLMKFI